MIDISYNNLWINLLLFSEIFSGIGPSISGKLQRKHKKSYEAVEAIKSMEFILRINSNIRLCH